MKLKPFLVIAEILLTVLLTIVVDRGIGLYFKQSAYFKAMVPNLTQYYKSSEYEFVAKTSNQGIRNEPVFEKKKGVLRILALGDSFTWGWGVDLEQSWPKVLDRKLRERGISAEVINAGIPGGDLKTEIGVCRIYADLFDVDMILVGLYGSDDLIQNLAQVEQQERYNNTQKFVDKITAHFWPNLIRFSQKKYIVDPGPGAVEGASVNISDIWQNMANIYLSQNPSILSNFSEKVREDFKEAQVSPHLVIQSTIDPNYLIHVLDSTLKSASLAATDRLFSNLASCVKERESIIVFLPSQEMVAPDYQKFRYELGYNVDPKLLMINLDSEFSSIAQKNGFSYLSLLSNFRADGCRDCFFPYDTHLTAVGQERVAERVGEYLLTQILNVKTQI